MSNPISALPDHIRLIDDQHLGRDQVIATYLLVGNEPALIDPGPTSTLATLEAGLALNGLALGDIQHVLLTHIHLDHAGASGTIVARNPRVHVYVHERGAPHMINPEKLLTSATRLYGELMDYLWGEFLPVPAERLTVLTGGEHLNLGGAAIDVHYAPGHASHHVIYHEQASGAAFIGDVGGVRLPNSSYVRPATPPPDVDIEAWDRSLEMLLGLDPQILALTHFGPAFDPHDHIASYRRRLRAWAELVHTSLGSTADETAQLNQLEAHANAELGNSPAEALRYEQATPLFQSWQGLVRYWKKREA